MSFWGLSVVIALVLSTACSIALTPTHAQLKLAVGSSSRFLAPELERLELAGVGPEGATIDELELLAGVNLVEGLIPGQWTLTVSGSNSKGDVIQRGRAVADLLGGSNQVTITLVSAAEFQFQWAQLLLPEGGEVITGATLYAGGDLGNPRTGPTSLYSDGLMTPLYTSGDVLVVTAATLAGFEYAWFFDGTLESGQNQSTCSWTMTSGELASGAHHILCVITDEAGGIYSQEILVQVGGGA